MFHWISRPLLARPTLYHYLRQVVAGGIRFDQYVERYGLCDPGQRIADIGCGPADILRYVRPERRPQFYLGLDISARYLDAARARARRAGIDAELMRLDLDRIPSDDVVRGELRGLLERHRITTALLLGVVHHIDDLAARTTIDLVHSVESVRRLITWDVMYLPGQRVNNFLCDQDRGVHVRDLPGYDELAGSTAWPRHERFFSSPRAGLITYVHYVFSK
jgi:SAM-dependent methyltransferase